MDTLEIQGRKYISSKRASQLTGYAKDYIGQLAREGRVEGTRIGRAWYVDEAAILNLAGISVSFAESESRNTPHVMPESTQKTLYSVALLHDKNRGNPFITWKSLNYLDDPLPLIPVVEPEKSRKIELNAEKTNKSIVHPSMRTATLDGVYIKRHEPQLKGIYSYIPVIAISASVLVIALRALTHHAEWSFSAQSSLASPLEAASQEAISTYFRVIFDEGVALIREFISTIIASFSSFFSSGLLFLINLLHLG